MTFWNWVQAIASAFGGLSFIAILLVLIFHEKFKDWVAGGADVRKHRLDLVKEHDRSNTEIQRQVIHELFRRKIAKHDAIRERVSELLKTIVKIRSDKGKDATPPEAIKRMEQQFAAGEEIKRFLLFTISISDISEETMNALTGFIDAANECIKDYSPDNEKDLHHCLAMVMIALRVELRAIYEEGFEKLLK